MKHCSIRTEQAYGARALENRYGASKVKRYVILRREATKYLLLRAVKKQILHFVQDDMHRQEPPPVWILAMHA